MTDEREQLAANVIQDLQRTADDLDSLGFRRMARQLRESADMVARWAGMTVEGEAE